MYPIVLCLFALLTLHKIVHEASPRCGATFRHFLFLNVVHAQNIKVKGVGNIGLVFQNIECLVVENRVSELTNLNKIPVLHGA